MGSTEQGGDNDREVDKDVGYVACDAKRHR